MMVRGEFSIHRIVGSGPLPRRSTFDVVMADFGPPLMESQVLE